MLILNCSHVRLLIYFWEAELMSSEKRANSQIGRAKKVIWRSLLPNKYYLLLRVDGNTFVEVLEWLLLLALLAVPSYSFNRLKLWSPSSVANMWLVNNASVYAMWTMWIWSTLLGGICTWKQLYEKIIYKNFLWITVNFIF